ncbi:MAG: hypothetical protein V1648_02510, partial [Candidatus Aenigmatarchaeota archaeon]
NESSKNFNFPPNRPDLVICSDAIKPKVLIDVKYNQLKDLEDSNNFVNLISIVTKGENKIILCNVDSYDAYLKESKNINCPIYIIKVYRVDMTEGWSFTFLGIELTEKLKEKLIIENFGTPAKKVYKIDFKDMLEGDILFDKISTLIKK